MKVHIIRSPGDKQAADIVDQLCTSDIAGKQRGRNYLDSQGFSKLTYDVDIAPQEMELPGAVIEIADASLGEVFRGKLTGWTLDVSGIDSSKPVVITTQISIERSVSA